MYKFIKRILSPDRKSLGYILAKGAIIVDVRSPSEFIRGHAEGAVNIPLRQIPRQIETIKSYNKPVVTCCALGMRAERASQKLEAAGITVHNGGPWQHVAAAQQRG
ncbi:MAG: rhodanese-like domain-containing protein [Bacteroidia bacterium]